MKTAVSLPNEVFEAAERFAKERGLTRSAVYTQALEVFLEAVDRPQLLNHAA